MKAFRSAAPMFATSAVLLIAPFCFADGLSIGPIKQPYVHALEREIEFNQLWPKESKDAYFSKSTAIGYAQSSPKNHQTELSVTGIDLPDGSLQASAIEFETQWQLTEQGEFEADWGMTAELEREIDLNRWEAGVTLLWERQYREWIATLNGGVHYEWGSDYDNEFETTLGAQLRYRYSALIEPTLVLHLNQDTGAVGPGLWIHQRLSPGRRLNWQLALLQGFKTTTPDQSLLVSLEYEFY